MRTGTWKALLAAGVLAAAALLGGCNWDDSATQTQEGVLRVGAYAAIPPFAYGYIWGESYEGFDLNMAEVLAKNLGCRLVFKSMEWEALVPALQSGQIDLVVGAVDEVAEWENQVAYSEPYFVPNNKIVLVRKDNTDIHGWEFLRGHTVGARLGTRQAEMAREEGAEVTLFRTDGEAIAALAAEGVDAVVADMPYWQFYLEDQVEEVLIHPVGAPREAKGYVFAMRRGNDEFRRRVNEAIEAVKEDGTYDYLFYKWFIAKDPE